MDRKRIARIARSLDYDFHTFQIDSFIAYIQTLRQRTLICQPVRLAAGLSGAWIRGKHLDFILFEQTTHPMHQNHIVLHEIGHMMLGHPMRPIEAVLPEALLALAATPHEGHLRPYAPNRFSDSTEREAEYFASVIQERVIRARRAEALTQNGTSQLALRPFMVDLFYREDRE